VLSNVHWSRPLYFTRSHPRRLAMRTSRSMSLNGGIVPRRPSPSEVALLTALLEPPMVRLGTMPIDRRLQMAS